MGGGWSRPRSPRLLAIAAATDTTSMAPHGFPDMPWATVRYGTPHISANTVTENCVPRWVKKPSRVPGRSHTFLRLPKVSATPTECRLAARPRGVSRTSATTSATASTPNAVTDR